MVLKRRREKSVEREMWLNKWDNPKNGFKYMFASIPHRYWGEGKFEINEWENLKS